MILLDVNVLVFAFREDAPDHARIRGWLDDVLASDEPFGISELVLSGFLRIVTHPRIFDPPTPLEPAIEFAEALRAQPNCVKVSAGDRRWEIFLRLCREADARGNLVPDAFLAALAIESGCEWITTDSDFELFAGLRWGEPGGARRVNERSTPR